MKRAGGLFDSITDARALALAAWKAAKGKQGRPEVRWFLEHLDGEVGRLARALREGSFEFGKYRTFTIRDPKKREIHAPPFQDRVVHHALIQTVGPIFERGAIAQSYACRAGRGQHAALRQARQWVGKGDWFLKGDVARFYDSVNQDLLRTLLARRFRERRLLALFDRLLSSYEHSPGKGLPIGALTSQYLGNFYLDPFDHWVKQSRHIHRYLRYMDDVLLIGERDQLNGAREGCVAVLEGFDLRIKHGGVLNRCELGVPYLGFIVYPNRVRLNRLGRRRLRRRWKELERGFERGWVSEMQLQARSEALFAHARFSDDLNWRRMVTRFSRFGETQEPDPRPAGRLLEQLGQELPLGVSPQEQAG